MPGLSNHPYTRIVIGSINVDLPNLDKFLFFISLFLMNPTTSWGWGTRARKHRCHRISSGGFHRRYHRNLNYDGQTNDNSFESTLNSLHTSTERPKSQSVYLDLLGYQSTGNTLGWVCGPRSSQTIMSEVMTPGKKKKVCACCSFSFQISMTTCKQRQYETLEW